MANTLERQILLDGHRNCVVKFTGFVDSADAVDVPALSLNELLNNDPTVTLYALRLNEVEYSVSDGLLLTVEWNSANPQQMLQLAGRGELCFREDGGLLPETTRPGFDGAINLRTQAYPPGTMQNFTVLLEFVKMYR